MGSVRPFVVLTLLLAAAGLGLARSPDGPPEYTTLTESDCWPCHKPGAFDPHMDPHMALIPEVTVFEAGDAFRLDARVQNVWLTRNGDYELTDFRVALDIGNAPSLQFVSDREPFSQTYPDGFIPIDPTAAQPPPPVQDPSYLTREHSGHETIEIPAGATEAVIRLIPGNQDPNTGPDLVMKLHPGLTEPADEPFGDPIDATGPGGTETFKADTSIFASAGFGNWTIEATTIPVDQQKQQVTPVADDIPFTVEVEAWFNASAETRQVVTSSDVILPDKSTLLSWDLMATSAPADGEALRFVVNTTAHYEHESSDPDYWDFTQPFEVPIDAAPDGGHQIGTEAAVVIAPKGPTGVSIAAISEAIGYIGAFLLISSVWTGGMFGKRSRRQLNVLFGSARRRVAFHNFLSYGIIAFTIVHTVIFIWDINGPLAADGYHWLLGVLWGGPSILAMLGLGVTGAIQVPMIRKWNYSVWRWTHFYLAIAAIVFTLVHMALDGQNFDFIREALGYEDPLVPEGFAA